MALSRSTTLKLGGVGAFLALEAVVLAMLFLGDDEAPDTTAAGRSTDTGGTNVAAGPPLPKPSATPLATKPAAPAPKPASTGGAAPVAAPPVQGPKPAATTAPKPATTAPKPQGPVVTKPARTPAPAAPAPTTAAPKPAAPQAPTVTQPQSGASTRYVVVRGDTLWEITERALGPAASADEVARTWHEVYEANRQVIGANPDVIRPGQTLTIPALR